MLERDGIDWTEEEITLALYLYYLSESGKIANKSRAQTNLALYLGRSEGSVSSKIENLRSCDEKGKGRPHISKLDKIVFNRYLLHPDSLDMDAKELIDKRPNDTSLLASLIDANPFEPKYSFSSDKLDEDFTGKDYNRVTKRRDDNAQRSFKNRLLANYGQQCCLSHVSMDKLLIASHIVPWSKGEKKRLDPRNGLLLNAYLDKAFDQGIISVKAEDYSVMISEKLKDEKALDYFNQFKGRTIYLPQNKNVWPETENLQYHNQVVFNNFDTMTIQEFPTFEEWYSSAFQQ